MENYPKTVRVAAIGGLLVLLALITFPFFATAVFAGWIIALLIAYRNDAADAYREDDDDNYDSYEPKEISQDRISQFLSSFNKTQTTETKPSTSVNNATGSLTPDQEQTLELLAAELKEESDKEFDKPIPLTWDTFNPLRWRKHK